MDDPIIQHSDYSGNGVAINYNKPSTNRQAAKDLAADNGIDVRGKSTKEILTDIALKKGLDNLKDIKESIDEFEKEQTKRRKTPPPHTQPEKSVPNQEQNRNRPPVNPPPPLPQQPNRSTKFVTPFYCWKDGVVGTISLTTEFSFTPL